MFEDVGLDILGNPLKQNKPTNSENKPVGEEK